MIKDFFNKEIFGNDTEPGISRGRLAVYLATGIVAATAFTYVFTSQDHNAPQAIEAQEKCSSLSGDRRAVIQSPLFVKTHSFA